MSSNILGRSFFCNSILLRIDEIEVSRRVEELGQSLQLVWNHWSHKGQDIISDCNCWRVSECECNVLEYSVVCTTQTSSLKLERITLVVHFLGRKQTKSLGTLRQLLLDGVNDWKCR